MLTAGDLAGRRVPSRAGLGSHARGRHGAGGPLGVRVDCEYELRAASEVDKAAWGLGDGVAGEIAVAGGDITSFTAAND